MSKLRNDLIKKIIDIDNDEDLIKYLETFVKIMKINENKENKERDFVASWGGAGGGAGGMIINPMSAAASGGWRQMTPEEIYYCNLFGIV